MEKIKKLITTEKGERKDVFSLTDKVKIGKSVYEIERHFSDKRDIREAVYTVVKNEAFK